MRSGCAGAGAAGRCVISTLPALLRGRSEDDEGARGAVAAAAALSVLLFLFGVEFEE